MPPENRERPVLRVVTPPPPEPPPRRFPIGRAALAAGLGLGSLLLMAAQLFNGWVEARIPGDPAGALALRSDTPAALAAMAEAQLNDDRTPQGAARAEALARAALAGDPMQGAAFRSLAIAAGRRGDRPAEARLMRIAGDRLKRDVPAQSWLIADLVAQGRYAEAADRADGLMRAWPVSMTGTMTLELSRMAANPNGAAVLARLMDSQPPWRSHVLTRMARFGDNPGAAMAVFTAMRSGRHPPTETETAALTQRLIQEGAYEQAFLVWAQLLPDEGVRNLADPYDGGFDGLPGGMPFNWQFLDRPGLIVEPAPAETGEGRVLYVRMTNAPSASYLARQLLALPAGRHTLTGRWKTEGLSAGWPLVWRLQCARRNQTWSAETDAVYGDQSWRTFSVTFEIPAGCTAQWLLLSSRSGKGRGNGEAWIDDLRITRGG
ncbi:MAG: hypothetical protein ACK4RV_16165 [Caulobacter sp.]|jgi:hypothetical protein